MFISAFELFKVGIGPSSSHTVGPMRAAKRFCDRLASLKVSERVEWSRLTAHLKALNTQALTAEAQAREAHKRLNALEAQRVSEGSEGAPRPQGDQAPPSPVGGGLASRLQNGRICAPPVPRLGVSLLGCRAGGPHCMPEFVSKRPGLEPDLPLCTLATRWNANWL